MGSAQNCQFIQATLCPGYTGPTPLWVSKPLLPGGLLGSGGAFAYNGACYSIPANAQPQSPASGSYASAAYMGESFSNCSTCCAAEIHPAYLSFCPSAGGTYTVEIQYGPPNAAFTASASSTGGWLSVSPASGKLDASGSASLTVTALPISNPPQGGLVAVDIVGCTQLTVTVNDADVPTQVPPGLASSYFIRGGPVTENGGAAIATCSQLSRVGGNYDGQVVMVGAGEWAAPCVYGTNTNIGFFCWEGYGIYAAEPVYCTPSAILAPDAGLALSPGSRWIISLLMAGQAGAPQQAGYVKLCGTTPGGVYVALSPGPGYPTLPQTLYVE